VRKRLCLLECAAQSAPVDIFTKHVDLRL
jgi:hypothetical protein